MKREISDLPAAKPPASFTGKGLEIIGDPSGSSGELSYRDGRCKQIGCAAPAFEPGTAPKRLLTITPAQQIAWLNLSRKPHIDSPLGQIPENDRERNERVDRNEAENLARHFATAILEGRLTAFMKQISRADAAEKKATRLDEDDNEPMDGFREALFAVAWNSSHPNEVTVSAVMDYLKSHPTLAIKHRIGESLLSAKEVRKHLASLGFGWIQSGRKRGAKTRQIGI